MKNFLIYVAIIITLIVVGKISNERQVTKDCYEWQSWQEETILFKPSADMIAMCAEKGVNLK